MNLWKIPPILGEVEDFKVKILFELTDKNNEVYFIINDDKVKGYYVYNEPRGMSNVVVPFKQAGTYTVSWFINNQIAYRHDVTVGHLKHLVFVSCDFLEADTRNSMWDVLNQQLQLGTGIVHLGDQAYMDAVYQQCRKLYKYLDKKTVEEKFKNYCYKLYANRYAETWRPHAEVLSRAANYYLWDDHEIANDIRLDTITDNGIKLIASAAVMAYMDYQQSFHIQSSFILNSYSWYKYINPSTIMLAIERTSRLINFDEVIGAIKYLDGKDGFNKLVLCFSSAPIPMPKKYRKLIDINKYVHPQELLLMYNKLFELNKNIILVGGDVHFGVHGYITKEKQMIQVLIGSPITNQPNIDRYLAAKGLKGTHTLSESINFVTIAAKARRCFGTLNLETWQTNMVWSKDKTPKNWKKYYKTIRKF